MEKIWFLENVHISLLRLKKLYLLGLLHNNYFSSRKTYDQWYDFQMLTHSICVMVLGFLNHTSFQILFLLRGSQVLLPKCLSLLKIHTLTFNPQGDGFRMCGLWEVIIIFDF